MTHTNFGDHFGLQTGDIVQEFGYDEDVDFALRDELVKLTAQPLEDEEYRGIADMVLAWWRSDDGDVDDLTDYLVDCADSLESGAGDIWCLVPTAKSEFAVSAADVSEAAKVAGQSVTTSMGISADWTAFRIVSRGH